MKNIILNLDYEFNLIFLLNEDIKEIQLIFKNLLNPLIPFDKIKALIILLFLSMLPLHNDRIDRKKAMLANV